MDRQANMLFTEELVYAALKEVTDPELGINIVDLGLIYTVDIADSHIGIVMMLTTPVCPLHGTFRNEIESILWRTFPFLKSVTVDFVWTPAMSTPEGRADLELH